MKSSLATAKSRVPVEADDEDDDEEDTSAAVGTARSAGGAPAGGMPGMGGFPGLGGMDLGAMMSNPAIMNMCVHFLLLLSDLLMEVVGEFSRAQQMMAGGGMEQMMNNPLIQQMVRGWLACLV